MIGKADIVQVVLATGLLLLVPLVAMQVSEEVNWSPADFLFAGVLLVATGLAFKLAAKRTNQIRYRAAFAVAIIAALLLVWLNLAVGLIGSEENPANLMYFGVLAVQIIGSLAARFQYRGMARAMFATALAQALVAVIALIFGMQHDSGSSVAGILILNGLFVALFGLSALLFRQRARA